MEAALKLAQASAFSSQYSFRKHAFTLSCILSSLKTFIDRSLLSVTVLEKLISSSGDFSSTRVAGTMSFLCSDLHAHVLEVKANSFWRLLFALVNVVLL